MSIDWWERIKITIAVVSLGFSFLITIFDYSLIGRSLFITLTKSSNHRSISGLALVPTFSVIATYFCYWTNPLLIKIAGGIVLADLGYLVIGYLLSYFFAEKISD